MANNKIIIFPPSKTLSAIETLPLSLQISAVNSTKYPTPTIFTIIVKSWELTPVFVTIWLKDWITEVNDVKTYKSKIILPIINASNDSSGLTCFKITTITHIKMAIPINLPISKIFS